MTLDKNGDSQPMAADMKVRPFPWICPQCLQKKVNMAVVPYQARRRRGGEMTTVEIPALCVPKCEHCGELLITYDVDDQIRKALDDADSQRAQVRPTATTAGTSSIHDA